MEPSPAAYCYAFTASSCLLFYVLFKFVSPFVSSRICGQKYNDFTPRIKLDWDTRFNSTIHAIIVTFSGIYLLLTDNAMSEDPLWVHTLPVRLVGAFIVGYMIVDLLLIVSHYKLIGDPFHLVHHTVCVIAGYHLMSYGIMGWFALFRMLSELSTPFVNLRWYLSKLGLKGSLFYKYNGRFMALTFFCSRILTIPTYWNKVYFYHGTPECLALGSSWVIGMVTCAALDILNCYWFMKILIGGCREEMNSKKQ